MNHTTLLTIGMIVAAATLIGAVGISVPSALGGKSKVKDPSVLDYANSETDFYFKQKLKNNCSGNAVCTNTGTESLGGS
jgi:hypothetical protein